MNPKVTITSHLPKRLYKNNYNFDHDVVYTYSISVNDITFLTLTKEEMKELADELYKLLNNY